MPKHLSLIAAQASALPDGAGGVPDWIKIAPAGRVTGIDGRGPYTLGDPNRVAQATYSARPLIPLDFNHQTVFAAQNGGEAPAAAWLDRMEARDDALWAHVGEWTERGEAAVRKKEYRFVSPTLVTDRTGQILRIESVGLVNTPNLTQLPAIQSAQGDLMDLSKLRQALGLPDDADEAAVLAALQARGGLSSLTALVQPLGALLGVDAGNPGALATAIRDRLRPALGLEANATDAQLVAAAAARLTAAPDPARFVPVSDVQALQAQVSALQAAETKRRAEFAVTAAMTAGKVAPALKNWALDLAAKDLTAFEQFVAAAPALVVPNGAAGFAGQPPSATQALTDEELAVCAALGLDRDAYLATKKETA